jgi:hypothetical protein
VSEDARKHAYCMYIHFYTLFSKLQLGTPFKFRQLPLLYKLNPPHTKTQVKPSKQNKKTFELRLQNRQITTLYMQCSDWLFSITIALFVLDFLMTKKDSIYKGRFRGGGGGGTRRAPPLKLKKICFFLA